MPLYRRNSRSNNHATSACAPSCPAPPVSASVIPPTIPFPRVPRAATRAPPPVRTIDASRSPAAAIRSETARARRCGRTRPHRPSALLRSPSFFRADTSLHAPERRLHPQPMSETPPAPGAPIHAEWSRATGCRYRRNWERTLFGTLAAMFNWPSTISAMSYLIDVPSTIATSAAFSL